jgi:hypothetical protein
MESSTLYAQRIRWQARNAADRVRDALEWRIWLVSSQTTSYDCRVLSTER